MNVAVFVLCVAVAVAAIGGSALIGAAMMRDLFGGERRPMVRYWQSVAVLVAAALVGVAATVALTACLSAA